MGLTLYDENKHALDSFFTSYVDGKKYLKLTVKEQYRYNYAFDLLRTKVLSFGNKEQNKKYEKMPPEAGYSLNFDASVVKFKNNDIAGIETYIELLSNWKKYGCHSLGRYYARTIDDVFKDTIINIVSGPPRGGISFEVAVCMNLMRKGVNFYHFTSDSISKQVYRKDAPKITFVYPDIGPVVEDSMSFLIKKGNVLICDDCLITGNSIRKEAKALLEKTELKDLKICGILVGVDCGFYGKSGKRVSEELEEEIGVKVESIADIEELIDNLLDNIPVVHYPVKDLDGWTLDKDKMLTPQYIEDCNASALRFEEEVCKPFARFMKMQREIIDLEKTIRRLRA